MQNRPIIMSNEPSEHFSRQSRSLILWSNANALCKNQPSTRCGLASAVFVFGNKHTSRNLVILYARNSLPGLGKHLRENSVAGSFSENWWIPHSDRLCRGWICRDFSLTFDFGNPSMSSAVRFHAACIGRMLHAVLKSVPTTNSPAV